MAKIPATDAKAATATAKPGTVDEKAKKEKKPGRVAYPGLKAADGTDVKLKAIPTDWDRKAHKGFSRKNFEDDALYLEWRAQQFDHAAAALRKQAEESKKLGNVKDRAKAKRLLQLQKRLGELQKQLADQGINVEALLASDNG